MTIAEVTNAQFIEEWQAWHEALDAARAAPEGFLAYAGFNILTSVPQRFEHIPGLWSTGDGGPVVELGEGESLRIDDVEITGRHAYGVIGERTFHRAGYRDGGVELSRRGGYDIVRPLRPDTPVRLAFTGTPTYEPDPRWVIDGVFEPFDGEPDIAIQAAIAPIVHTHTAAGRIRFTFEGEEHTLVALRRGADAATIPFKDATSGVTTYGASRTLAVSLPSDGGSSVTLDFNRASNLQCAYIDFSPCPLAPAENRLPFPVEAGEKIPSARSSDF